MLPVPDVLFHQLAEKLKTEKIKAVKDLNGVLSTEPATLKAVKAKQAALSKKEKTYSKEDVRAVLSEKSAAGAMQGSKVYSC